MGFTYVIMSSVFLTIVVQSPSCVLLFATPHQDSLSLTISRSLPKFMSIESVMPSNHLILCLPLLLPSIFPIIRVFSNESVKGDSLKNTLMLGKIEGRKRREAEKEMVRWHH